jgi:hypothetical protein
MNSGSIYFRYSSRCDSNRRSGMTRVSAGWPEANDGLPSLQGTRFRHDG